MSARLVIPSACRWDGIPEREHAQQWVSPSKGGPGWHVYERPTDAQVLERMRARRMARLETLRTSLQVGALLEQRHQFLDPAEPPLGGAQPEVARDCARSLAEGHMTPPVWDDDPAPTRRVQEDLVALLGLPEPTPPAPQVETVRVRGGVL